MLIPQKNVLLKMNLHPVRAAVPQSDLGDVVVDTSPAPKTKTEEAAEDDVDESGETEGEDDSKSDNKDDEDKAEGKDDEEEDASKDDGDDVKTEGGDESDDESSSTEEDATSVVPLEDSPTATVTNGNPTATISEQIATLTGAADVIAENKSIEQSSNSLPWSTAVGLNILIILLSVSFLSVIAYYIRRAHRRRKHRALLLSASTHPSANPQFHDLDDLPPTHAPLHSSRGGRGKVSNLVGKLKMGRKGKEDKGHVRWGSDEMWNANARGSGDDEKKSLDSDDGPRREQSVDETWESGGTRRGMGAHGL